MPFKSDVHDNQTEILLWLRALGHEVVELDDADEAGRHKRRSCSSKRRFACAITAQEFNPRMSVYECRYCLGFHLATPR